MIRFGKIEICGTKKFIKVGDRWMLCCGNRNGLGSPEAITRFKAFKYLLLANGNGMTREQLFDLVYGHLENGGPNRGPGIFDTKFNQWQGWFEYLHVEVKREKRGGKQFLRMVPIADVV